VDCIVNVQRSDWLKVFPNSTNPLTSVLCAAFAVPSDLSTDLNMLLRRMERFSRPR